MSSNHHHYHGENQTEGKLWISIFLNLGITLAEFIGGLVSGSPAKARKEQSMADTLTERFLADLAAARSALDKPRGNQAYGQGP